MILDRDGYILGLDPPATSALGWAIFKYDHNLKTAYYIDSGGIDIEGKKESKRFLNIKNFLIDLHKKYDPIILYCIERAIGRGFDVTREQLGENTGVIKLIAYENGARPLGINTLRMFKNLEIPNVKKVERDQKKLLTCQKIKDMFPNKLESKKISKSGNFTHEADAIGFIISHCKDYEITLSE
jgi:Holliday junction resolvasome RuvABC endonuclease subunit